MPRTTTVEEQPSNTRLQAERETETKVVEKVTSPVIARLDSCELSVVVPTINEEGNIGEVVAGVRRVCEGLGVSHEVLVVDGGSTDRTAEEAEKVGAVVIHQEAPGYGTALKEAFSRVSGAFVVTMDSDLSHPPNVIRTLYQNRHRGEILVASRYIKGGQANMPWSRKFLSKTLNKVYSRILDIPVADLSSGFRLYRRSILPTLETRHADFSYLPEVLIRGYSAGYVIHEVPFHYFPRVKGTSKARVLKFGISYLKLLGRLWRMRNSVESADYDERAYDSWILPQRWWQRRRYSVITGFVDRSGTVLDIGCGSSRIFEALPGATGLDISQKKLRYRRTVGNLLICGRLQELPVKGESFEQIICSEVIEHLPGDKRIFSELNRVLKPGGTLILGTPDYGKWQWNLVEWIYGKVIPGGYANEHITHYTFDSLKSLLDDYGFDWLEHRYVFQGELIVKARKRSS